MNARHFVMAATFAALSAPAFASGVIHSANTEVGYTTHPDHATQGLSRSQVLADLKAAQQQPSWSLQRWGNTPQKFEPKLTREQVAADLKTAQQHPTWAARRVGAPVSMN